MSSVLPVVLDKSPKISVMDSSDCLECLKDFWLLVHYPDSFPEAEYEVLNHKDLDDDWDTLEKGAAVSVKCGNAKVHGTIVSISDDDTYLKNNFTSLVEEYKKELQNKSKEGKLDRRENRFPYIERHVIKVADKETQTDLHSNDSSDVDYNQLKLKYDELKTKYERFQTLYSDVKSALEETVSKLETVKTETTIKTSPKPALTVQNKLNKQIKQEEDKENIFSKTVQIGSKGTRIPKRIYDTINWNNYSAATRKLLTAVFPREVLATHSLTGKPSPAFLASGKKTKNQLDPTIIQDIIEAVSRNSMISESLVRSSITTKCADENKLWRKRTEKRKLEEDPERNRKKIK